MAIKLKAGGKYLLPFLLGAAISLSSPSLEASPNSGFNITPKKKVAKVFSTRQEFYEFYKTARAVSDSDSTFVDSVKTVK